MSDNRTQNELVLSPGEFALSQDTTSGILKCITGPGILQITGQETPVAFDPKTGRFARCDLATAVQQFALAKQGQYMVLSNPAQNGKQPVVKEKSAAAELNMGQKVNIQGPITFALWPGQSATVIEGHNLRSNQYLRIRVYDEDAARENWTKGVVKAAQIAGGASDDADAGKGKAQTKGHTQKGLFEAVPGDLAVGKHYIVRGDEFSFYIPPTGVEVVTDDNGSYVRDATTLERLEYCILIDENGSKRYEQGPKVVFPTPTERFFEEQEKGQRICSFKPIELNEIQGLHVKVISDYAEADGTQRKEGEELFIRGSETPIYFPRPEHAPVKYDGKFKHFATAVPAGEARYVLERKTGAIRTVKGPCMLLPDPRTEVIVRRVLSDKQCNLWYPGNLEAQRYNSTLRELMRVTPTTRPSGTVSEGEVTRSKKVKQSTYGNVSGFADSSLISSDSALFGTDEFSRGSTYTEPRTVTLDTKFGGVPTIEVWTGYAVLIIDKQGNRRVEIGPKTIQLEYDEQLEVLSMSTGKPKNTDQLVQTVYLRVKNNQIGDVVTAETRDHVNVSFKVSLRGDFTDEPGRWFECENYVKLVCDHVRSVLKAEVRKLKVEEIYSDPTSIVRDAILGARGGEDVSRRGMLFDENGFHILDVEVLDFKVGDDRIAQMLDNTQHSVVESNISLALAEKKLEIDRRQEEIDRERVQLKTETERLNATTKADLDRFNVDLETERVARHLKLSLDRISSQIDETTKREEMQAVEQRLLDEKQGAELARQKKDADVRSSIDRVIQELELARSREETEHVIQRFQAANGPLAEALLALGNQDTVVKLAEALSVQSFIGGKTVVDVVQKVFAGSPAAGLVEKALQRALPASVEANGASGGTKRASA